MVGGFFAEGSAFSASRDANVDDAEQTVLAVTAGVIDREAFEG